MKRLALVFPLLVALLLAASAGAAQSRKVKLKENDHVVFADIECVAKRTTYAYLTCVSAGKYEVAVSKRGVIVVRGRDGRVIYHTPY
jgi:hypothetical protein